MDPTDALRKIIKDKEIDIKAMSRETGISYMQLYDSLSHSTRRRKLRAGEFLKVCKYLGISPETFM